MDIARIICSSSLKYLLIGSNACFPSSFEYKRGTSLLARLQLAFHEGFFDLRFLQHRLSVRLYPVLAEARGDIEDDSGTQLVKAEVHAP